MILVMRTVELSDHPGDMLSDSSRQRQAAGPQALTRYSGELVRYRARVQRIGIERDQARAAHRWWAWLRLAVAGWREKRRVPRRPAPATWSADTDERIRAGIAGEHLVAVELGRALDDDWTLLHGYRNRRGEIDHLLLGPLGLFAIEVKNVNATVHIDGDRWRADKYDNYGNLVEQRPIADRTGRSPSEQVNEPADDLEHFLRQRGQPAAIQRAVVLTHRRSRLGRVRDPTVEVGTSTGDLLGLLRDPASPAARLGPGQRIQIERLIRQDHAFHDRRRRPRPSR